MKDPQKTVKNKANQLGKHLFTYIVAILFALLFVFSVFENLNMLQNSKQKAQIAEDMKKEMLLNAIDEAQEEAGKNNRPGECEVYVWRENAQAIGVVKTQLSNMKILFRTTEILKECKNAQILFVGGGEFSDEEIRTLEEYSHKEMILFFTELPKESLLEQERVQKLLGIASYDGVKNKEGIRITGKLLFDDSRECKEQYSLPVVTLGKRTEVYVLALQEDAEEADMEPLFWRYKPQRSEGNIYVADKMLMTDATGYAVVAYLFEDIYQTFMYPIVNAYCFIVAGMPYSKNVTSEYLQNVYGRDAIGIESDILFSEWNRCKDRYDLSITWYTRESDFTQSNAVMEYYIKSISQSRETVGQICEDRGTMEIDSVFDNTLQEWNTGFEWLAGNRVRIPYRTLETANYQSDLLKNQCWMRGTGFNSIYVNVWQFLEEGGEDWVTFSKSLETLFGVEKQNNPWLERTSVKEAVYRIMAHQVMQPKIVYEEERIDVSIQFFTGEAYFYLTTPKQIGDSENAEVEQIAEDIYLVKVTNEAATIFFEK